jgi:hypothetical protein
MLSFLKRIFGAKPAEPSPAPYKVEQFPFPKAEQEKKPAKAKKPVAKKPAAKRAPKKSKE